MPSPGKRRRERLAFMRKARRKDVPVLVRRGTELVLEHVDSRPSRMHAKNVIVRTAVNRSGQVFRRPMLHLQDKRMREEIISGHYRAVMAHHGIDVPGTLVARDDPHDFTYRHSDGSELLLEIVSFSDRAGNWAVVEAERRLMDALRDAGIANSSIAILPQGMSTRAIPSLMRSIQSQPIERNVDDHWLQERMARASATKQPALFLLPDKTGTRHNLLFNVRRPLLETVRESIEAKVLKAYPLAAEMVLIVDEQSTQHSPIDFNNAWDDLILACQQYPFREIHLYSGYYSNDDGLGAEFSLFTLKSVVNPHVGNVLKRGRCHSFHA